MKLSNGWTIEKVPIDFCRGPYEATHDDYDGAPDGNRHLWFTADSWSDAIRQIYEIERTAQAWQELANVLIDDYRNEVL